MTGLPTKDQVAGRIRRMMEVKNLTVSQTARICELAQPTLEGYLRGLNMPGGEGIAKLAIGLSCSADWLLAGGDK